MDIQTIDNEYQQLQVQAQQVSTAVEAFASKLQTAAQSGDANARDWALDLRALTLQIQQEQLQMQSLLQAMHGFAVTTLQAPPPQPPPQQYAQPVYQQAPPQYVQAVPMSAGFMGGGGQGGMLQNFLGSGFGRAIAMGAGFGIGDDLINKIF